jgi:hypothetical protein
MTVASELNRKEYAGNGVTTAFATSPVVFFDSGDLDVYVVSSAGVATLKTITTHYTVTGGDGSTGTVTMLTAPATGETLVIVRTLDITQSTDFVNNDSSDAEVAEDTIDRLTMIAQQIDAKVDRSFVLADSDVSGASTTIPTPAACKIIGWDSAGTALQNYSAADIDAALVSVFGATLIDDADAATARATLDAQEDVVTTAGDLVVGGASGAATRKAKGTNGQVLMSDSAQTDDLLWAPLAFQPGGRLTLETAVPVSTSDQSGKTTVYYTPYKHNGVQLYDGAGWISYTFTELSQLTTDNTKSPAAVANNSNYDVFVWNDSGTLRATRGPAWTSDTGRGTGAATTELELFEGRYVNKVAITNGPAARMGLYVGTIRSNGSAQINDTLALRHVWNNYNRVARPMKVLEATNSWTYTTATYRQANNSAANQVDFVIGLSEDVVRVRAEAAVSNNTSAIVAITAVGLNRSNADDSTTSGPSRADTVTARRNEAEYLGFPGIGRHFITWVEWSTATGTTTWFGADSGNAHHGLSGEVLA